MLISATNAIENSQIWESGDTFIKICALAAPTLPAAIMEQSASLSGSGVGQFRGSINAHDCDSIAFNGQDISTTFGQGLFCQGYGQVSVQLCKLASPSILTPGPFINRAFACLISGAPAFSNVITLPAPGPETTAAAGPQIQSGRSIRTGPACAPGARQSLSPAAAS